MAEESLAPVERPDGVKLIEEERLRQQAPPPEGEDWTAEHDDANHDLGDLALAAACYALCSVVGEDSMQNNGHLDVWWPWDTEYWRPADQKRMLVKAGALIAAEIDRIDRLAARTPAPGSTRGSTGQAKALSAWRSAAGSRGQRLACSSPAIWKQHPPRHTPVSVWQERAGEFSWLCSCGTRHKHQPLRDGAPVELRCAELAG